MVVGKLIPLVGAVLEGEASLRGTGWLIVTCWDSWLLTLLCGQLSTGATYSDAQIIPVCLFLSCLIIFSSTSLSLGTAACFRYILYFVQAVLVPFSMEMVPREHDLGARCDHCFWGVTASGPLSRQNQGREVWYL